MEGTYKIESVPQPETSSGISVWEISGGTEPYVVKVDMHLEWTCSCRDFFFRRHRDRSECKHIRLIRQQQEEQAECRTS